MDKMLIFGIFGLFGHFHVEVNLEMIPNMSQGAAETLGSQLTRRATESLKIEFLIFLF
jgi:hypothetical protein